MRKNPAADSAPREPAPQARESGATRRGGDERAEGRITAPRKDERRGAAARQQALPGFPLKSLDLGDIMLLAVLLLLYNDSRDEDFLIILGVLAFSMFRGEG